MPTGERIEEENKKLVSKPLARFTNKLLLPRRKQKRTLFPPENSLAVFRVGRVLLFFFRKRKGM
tara:strand:+ start:289 stop:480 length:192 start_codon:yes stop_codon:yes gene_type:complete